MGSELVQVNWEAREKILFTNLNALRKKEIHTDVVLSCEGKNFSAHRLILTMGSGYFTKAFEGLMKTPPSIVLICGIRHTILEASLNFIYEGKTTIKADNIPELSKAGEMLEIPGLMDLGREFSSQGTETKGMKDSYSKESNNSHNENSKVLKSIESESKNFKRKDLLKTNSGASKKTKIAPGLSVEALFESDTSDSEKPSLFEGWVKEKSPLDGKKPSESVYISKFTKKKSNKGKKKTKRCDICKKGFYKTESLQYHMEEHFYKPKFSCSHCGKAFNIEKNYLSHLSSHGTVKEKENVRLETKSIDTATTISVEDISSSSSSNSVELPVENATKRKRRSTDDSIKDYTIDDILESVSQSFERLSDDQQFTIADDSIYENGLSEGDVHKLPTDKEAKEQENFTSDSIGRLKEILNLKSSVESVNTRVCRFCNIEFLSSKVFRKHRTTACKILECQYCLQNFDEKAEFDEHVIKHIGVIKPYVCTECTFCTDKKWSFEDHMSLHTGIYRFWCLLCDFQAKRLCDLKIHMQETHPEVNINALESLLSK